MEMTAFSHRRRVVFAGVLALALAMAIAPQRAAAQEGATESALLKRVKEYYAALTSRKFDDIWTSFLAENMRQDTPREEYVRILAATVGQSKLSVNSSKVSIERTGPDNTRLLGRSVTPIKVVTGDNRTIEASHTTLWLFQEIPNSKPGWVLAGDAMNEKH